MEIIMSVHPYAAHAVSVLQGLGWTRAHAIGAVANIEMESGLNPAALGDHGQAHGICQWHPDRVHAILNATGIDVRHAGLDAQLKALDWEMRHRETDAMAAVAKTSTPFAAGYAFCAAFERPADLHHQAAMRGNMAAELARAIG